MNQHPSTDELTLFYYGEAQEFPQIEQHLHSCVSCLRELDEIQRVLEIVDMPVPHAPAGLEDRVWARVQSVSPWHRLTSRLPKLWGWPARLTAAAALASLLVASFFVGRYTVEPVNQAVKTPGRDRVVILAVGDHLDRSELILMELSNREGKKVDIADERAMAQSLLHSNRLYRQTAAAEGDVGMAELLDDLERVLVEVAHAPASMSGDQLEDLKDRIESQGLLFKVRVVGSQLDSPAPDNNFTSTGKEL